MLVTCEHGGHRVPAAYRRLFTGRGRLLQSHRGWDRGALDLARRLAGALGAPLHQATVTRLLVDLNRSAPRNLFSPISRGLNRARREEVLARYHRPYRQAVRAAVARGCGGDAPLLHLSVHTFTPVLRGRRRRTHVGLLYDPARGGETSFCAAWRDLLRRRFPAWNIHRNQPYRGSSDGLATWLRTLFPEAKYLGVELEVNQALLNRSAPAVAALCRGLADTLREASALVLSPAGPRTAHSQCGPRTNSS
jgi:predicted N-formylglutamate amidohydrolase